MRLMENENGINKILIFYKLLGDAPERILLATLDMHDNDDDWESWRLLPGPTILRPTLEFEHGNTNVAIPSTFGSASCNAHAQFRDPSFLQDVSNDDISGSDGQYHRHLTGTLFYTIQGEWAFATSRLDIDLDALFGATRFRDHTLIPDAIQHASSLEIEWSTLLQLEPMCASIAMKMSLEFGYQVPDEYVYNNVHYGDISTLQYQCGCDQN
jgi:hypothetical protein